MVGSDPWHEFLESTKADRKGVALPVNESASLDLRKEYWKWLSEIIHSNINKSLSAMHPHHTSEEYSQEFGNDSGFVNGTHLYEQDCLPPFDAVIDFIQFYYLPCITLIGLVGNLLSCIVFLTTHLKMRSSSYYLAALACADFGFLVLLLLVWLSGILDFPLFHVNGFCQCIVYLSTVCGFLSVWLIVAFTVERFIAVQYPLHRPHMCTVARAKAIVIYLVVFAALSHSYVFVTSGIIEVRDGEQVCDMRESHRDTMRVINIIDSLVTLIIPFVLIGTMNVMIAVNLFRFSQRFKRHDMESSFRETSDISLKPLPPVSEFILLFYFYLAN